jgi:Zn ribbon nucleic-acid-binding protein
MVTYAVVITRFSRWRCPRCGRIFAGTWWYNKGLLVRNCFHCGLPKFAGSRPNQ